MAPEDQSKEGEPLQKALKENKSVLAMFRDIGVKTKLAVLGVILGGSLAFSEIKNSFLTKQVVKYELNKKQNKLHDVINRDEDIGIYDYLLNTDIIDEAKIDEIDKIINGLKEKIDKAENKEEIKKILKEFVEKKDSNFDKFIKALSLTDDEKKGIEEVLNEKGFILKMVDYFSKDE